MSTLRATRSAMSDVPGRAGPIVRQAKAVSASPAMEFFFRFGYVVRGLIYLIPGVLALRLPMGRPGAVITQTEAIAMVGREPLGRVLLLVISMGLASYVMWGVTRVVVDPLHRGHSRAGIIDRLGYASSALAYIVLTAATVRLLVVSPSTAQSQDWTTGLLAKPLGAWLVGIVGLGWLCGAGIAEIVKGWRGTFERDLRFERMGRRERWIAIRLGRFGTVVRGVLFTIVGILLVTVAFHTGGHSGTGIDSALLTLLRQPYGRFLFAAGALGLIAFGAYSVMCARWVRMHVGERSPAVHLISKEADREAS